MPTGAYSYVSELWHQETAGTGEDASIPPRYGPVLTLASGEPLALPLIVAAVLMDVCA